MKTEQPKRAEHAPRVVVTWTHLCVLVIVCVGVVAAVLNSIPRLGP